jgi:ribosome biogenesis protein Tsr3
MNTTENLIFVENPFRLSTIDKVSATIVSGEPIFRIEKKTTETVDISWQAMMEQPVNNYLKTQEEMEREFCFVINSRNTEFGSTMTMNTDGYINIHNPDELLSGYMEENY